MVHKVSERKRLYREKLEKLFQDYKNILLVTANHVGSNQFQKIRIGLRGRAVVLMGKNTIIRMVIRENAGTNPKLASLLPQIRGNVGFIFTNEDLSVTRDVVTQFKEPAPARAGVYAPCNVVIPPGPTGLDPGQTAFFQALNIGTKIARGCIEIVNKVNLIKTGERVTASHVSLLSKLNIKPFEYGLIVKSCYEDGAVYDASLLDLTDADLLSKFFNGVRYAAAIGMSVGIPSLATVPHQLSNAFRKLLAISMATEYTFEEAKQYKEYLADPTKFAAAEVEEEKPKEEEAAAAEPEEEEEEESDVGLGGGLFGDEESDSD